MSESSLFTSSSGLRPDNRAIWIEEGFSNASNRKIDHPLSSFYPKSKYIFMISSHPSIVPFSPNARLDSKYEEQHKHNVEEHSSLAISQPPERQNAAILTFEPAGARSILLS